MKVILAGMSKTGTKSMAAALQELGYNVHDFLEHYLYNGDNWKKICYNGGTIEDFRKMYSDNGADAVVDLPVWHFWEELLQAFPDAKIILTVRDSEDQWLKSLKVQSESMQTPIFLIMQYLSPTWRKFYNHALLLGTVVFGVPTRLNFNRDEFNELLLKMTYRRHNTYVKETAPKDKLLIYNLKEGWEPLCKFLGKDVPEKPFPHKNVRGNITKEMMKNHPLFIRMQREMMGSLLLLAAVFGFGCYKCFKSPPKSPFHSVLGYGSIAISSVGQYLKF